MTTGRIGNPVFNATWKAPWNRLVCFGEFTIYFHLLKRQEGEVLRWISCALRKDYQLGAFGSKIMTFQQNIENLIKL